MSPKKLKKLKYYWPTVKFDTYTPEQQVEILTNISHSPELIKLLLDIHEQGIVLKATHLLQDIRAINRLAKNANDFDMLLVIVPKVKDTYPILFCALKSFSRRYGKKFFIDSLELKEYYESLVMRIPSKIMLEEFIKETIWNTHPTTSNQISIFHKCLEERKKSFPNSLHFIMEDENAL